MWSSFCDNYLRSLFLKDFYLITYFLLGYMSTLHMNLAQVTILSILNGIPFSEFSLFWIFFVLYVELGKTIPNVW